MFFLHLWFMEVGVRGR